MTLLRKSYHQDAIFCTRKLSLETSEAHSNLLSPTETLSMFPRISISASYFVQSAYHCNPQTNKIHNFTRITTEVCPWKAKICKYMHILQQTAQPINDFIYHLHNPNIHGIQGAIFSPPPPTKCYQHSKSCTESANINVFASCMILAMRFHPRTGLPMNLW